MQLTFNFDSYCWFDENIYYGLQIEILHFLFLFQESLQCNDSY